jgi:hypothetical protein
MPHSADAKEYVKKSYSLEKGTGALIDEIADEYGMPKSCVVNIAVSRPEKFKKLLRTTDAGAKVEALKKEPDLFDQFFDWLNGKDTASESESEAGEEESKEEDD